MPHVLSIWLKWLYQCSIFILFMECLSTKKKIPNQNFWIANINFLKKKKIEKFSFLQLNPSRPILYAYMWPVILYGNCVYKQMVRSIENIGHGGVRYSTEHNS